MNTHVWQSSTLYPLRCQPSRRKSASKTLIEFIKNNFRSILVFSSSLDSAEPPVKSGFEGCVGWSGVWGSGRGEEVLSERLERFGGMTAADELEDRFPATVLDVFEEGRTEGWLACIACFARSFVSWISMTVNSELKAATKSGARVFRTSSISIIPSLRSLISTAPNCRAPSSTPKVYWIKQMQGFGTRSKLWRPIRLFHSQDSIQIDPPLNIKIHSQ